MPYSVPQVIEIFHLAFLTTLRTRVDQSRYVLKGGVNLRYFFNSDRYSEDIDFDIHGVADWQFVERVAEALEVDPLSRLLRSADIALDPTDISLKKDTATTKRWRLLLTAAGHKDKIRTKIEFSARNGETRFELLAVPGDVVRPYALRPPLVQHYLGEPAAEQKVIALAKRPETQARDVFDLELLLRRYPLEPDAVDHALRKDAAEAAVALTYADFEAQVLRFLDEEIAGIYDEPAWATIQDYVVGELLR